MNRGSVLACGFLLRWEVTGIDEARRRVLQLWHGRMQVKTTGDAFVVLLPEPLRVTAEETVGEPLVRIQQVLAALPLDAEEITGLELPPDSIVFARDGQIHVLQLTSLKDEDVATWLDTSGIAVAEVVSLGPPPLAPRFTPVTFDAREDIPGVPPASPELKQLLSEIRQVNGPTPAQPEWRWRKAWAATRTRMRRWFQRIRQPAQSGATAGQQTAGASSAWRNLRNLMRRLRQRVFSKRPPAQTTRTAATAPAKKKENRLGLWLNHTLARTLYSSGWWKLFADRQAQYMVRMMRMLQYGDVQEGLRHAIPLSAAKQLEGKLRYKFGKLRPRASLSIRPNRPTPAYTMAMGQEMFDYLHDLYRETFQRLDAQGRVEEAAFVLVELLAQFAEAVSYLEKHGRLRLAAEIAEARGLTPAIGIRLWWLAGERQRAIAFACRSGEFEAAIRLLSAEHPEEADKLRSIWAQRLAEAGKFTAAAEAIWPVKEDRYLAGRWLGMAIELGGTSGAVALARKVARFRESFDEVLPKAETLLADDTAEQVTVRLALIDALLHEDKTAESQALARVAGRALVRDIQQHVHACPLPLLRKILDYSGDPVLRADVPGLSKLQTAPRSPSAFQVIEVAAHDTGLRSISDVALLPDGRLLLALGEAGMLLLSRSGKIITLFNQPAQKLVVADHGSRVIAIAQRDSVCRLTRVDVLARTATYWCDATITAWCSTFDGSLWMVANDVDVFVIDTLAKNFEALWRIPDMGGQVRAIQRSPDSKYLYIATDTIDELTLWTYEAPLCTLRFKQPFTFYSAPMPPMPQNSLPLIGREAVLITEEGLLFEKTLIVEPGDEPVVKKRIAFFPGQGRNVVEGLITSGNWRWAATSSMRVAVPVVQQDGIDVLVLNTDLGTDRCWVRLRGAQSVGLRLVQKQLLCADDLGRVLMLDLNTGAVLRNLRV